MPIRIRWQRQSQALFFERMIRIRKQILPCCFPLPFLIMYHTFHMRCCRPDLVIDMFLTVGLTCKDLKSAKVHETAATSKKHETIVEGPRLRIVHIMERPCICMRAHVYLHWYICIFTYVRSVMNQKNYVCCATNHSQESENSPRFSLSVHLCKTWPKKNLQNSSTITTAARPGFSSWRCLALCLQMPGVMIGMNLKDGKSGISTTDSGMRLKNISFLPKSKAQASARVDVPRSIPAIRHRAAKSCCPTCSRTSTNKPSSTWTKQAESRGGGGGGGGAAITTEPTSVSRRGNMWMKQGVVGGKASQVCTSKACRPNRDGWGA